MVRFWLSNLIRTVFSTSVSQCKGKGQQAQARFVASKKRLATNRRSSSYISRPGTSVQQPSTRKEQLGLREGGPRRFTRSKWMHWMHISTSTRLPAPHLIKVDVEGFEVAVFAGRRRKTIQRWRPAWFIEIHTRGNGENDGVRAGRHADKAGFTNCFHVESQTVVHSGTASRSTRRTSICETPDRLRANLYMSLRRPLMRILVYRRCGLYRLAPDGTVDRTWDMKSLSSTTCPTGREEKPGAPAWAMPFL
jgi:hypothetical protein